MTTPPSTSAGVEKRFGDLVAVRSLDLQIERGEFFSIIGRRQHQVTNYNDDDADDELPAYLPTSARRPRPAHTHT